MAKTNNKNTQNSAKLAYYQGYVSGYYDSGKQNGNNRKWSAVYGYSKGQGDNKKIQKIQNKVSAYQKRISNKK